MACEDYPKCKGIRVQETFCKIETEFKFAPNFYVYGFKYYQSNKLYCTLSDIEVNTKHHFREIRQTRNHRRSASVVNWNNSRIWDSPINRQTFKVSDMGPNLTDCYTLCHKIEFLRKMFHVQISALLATFGDVSAAIERLLGSDN